MQELALETFLFPNFLFIIQKITSRRRYYRDLEIALHLNHYLVEGVWII